MTVDNRKKLIRKEIRAKKATFSLEEKKQKSVRVLEKLEKLEEFVNAKTVMLYWSMDDEVYTHDFILTYAKSKRIILPSVNGDDLVLKEYLGNDSLVKGEGFGILEPDGCEFDSPEEIDLIVVPGVAFDKGNNRMGRGRGYYDKFLESTKAYKVGICFDFQLLDEVPTDEHDILMDSVITE